MVDKILVEVYVPVIGESFDVYIPVTSKLHEVETLLTAALSELTEGRFHPAPDTVLCDKLSGQPLDINSSAMELGLLNGARLMLI